MYVCMCVRVRIRCIRCGDARSLTNRPSLIVRLLCILGGDPDELT